MADPKTKDEDQNEIRPETDWPSPNIRPPRQWSVELKQFISNFGLLIVIIIGFIITIGCIYLLYDIIRIYFDTGNEKQFAELRNSLFILAALVGVPFFVWRTMLAAEQTKTAEKQATIAQEKSYTELFTQAIEQLGSVKPVGKDQYEENIEVRVGALYALERIMHDSDKDAKTIIDTLCTYVKHNCGKPKIFDEEVTEEDVIELQKAPPANRYDIQTALKIIGRRPPKYKTNETMPDLTKVNLQGANLVRFDLSLCNLANAHLEGVKLVKANLKNSILDEANLRRAVLINADLLGTELWRANLQRADLYATYLQELDLRGADLREADLREADLQKAVLLGANLQGALLQRANMNETNLNMANLQETNLWGVDLRRAKLQGAELQGARIDTACITDAKTTAASVLRVDFTLTEYDFDKLQKQIQDMFGHKTLTILPEGMKVPDHWSEADMDTYEGYELYMHDWEAFKKEKGVE